MIVRTLKNVIGTKQDIHTSNWNSRRLLLNRDGMGFSLHDTVVKPNTKTEMCYKHHLEAVYCVEGEGSVVNLETMERFEIYPGTVYALDQHDKHILEARTKLRLVCVFNPPLVGDEVHGEDGAYPILTESSDSSTSVL